MLEGDGAHGGGSDPPVRHGPDVVLGGQGLKDGDGEHHRLRLPRHSLATQGTGKGLI